MGIQKTFKALSDRNRRQILDLLKRRPMTAGEIGEHFPVSGATMSHHLSVSYTGAGAAVRVFLSCCVRRPWGYKKPVDPDKDGDP